MLLLSFVIILLQYIIRRVYGYFLLWEKAQGAKYAPFGTYGAYFIIARVACRSYYSSAQDNLSFYKCTHCHGPMTAVVVVAFRFWREIIFYTCIGCGT